MPSIRVETNAFVLAGSFGRDAVLVGPKVKAITRKFGGLLESQVKAHASGRPGPRTITGDYRRSIALWFASFGTSAYAEVGTNAPQGRRLEHGFVGRDSLGRHYNQPPYPHFAPAFAMIAPRYYLALFEMVQL